MARRTTPDLEVRRMFDPNRFADEVVADAYRLIVPVIQRMVSRPVSLHESRRCWHRRPLQRGDAQP